MKKSISIIIFNSWMSIDLDFRRNIIRVVGAQIMIPIMDRRRTWVETMGL
jgi:hypothetical protein